MDINRILVCMSISAYDALNIFMNELITTWENCGIKVDRIHVDDRFNKDVEYALDNSYDVIFSFNEVFVGMEYKGKLLLEQLKAPFYSYLVDHPMHLHQRIVNAKSQKGFICVDSSFEEYLKRYYKVRRSLVLFQGGVLPEKDLIPYRERKHNVVFCGAYRSAQEELDKINNGDPQIRGIISAMIDSGLRNPQKNIEKILWDIIHEYNLSIQEDEFAECMVVCKSVELIFRGFYREQLIKKLLDAEIEVEVYGNGWENLEHKNKELLHCNGEIPYERMNEVYGDTKILLNVMPWAKNGFHDRIANGMLNGALVISDDTTYLSECNRIEKKCELFLLEEISSVSKKVQYYLNNEKEAEKIARNGYLWAKENHQWKDRAYKLLEFFRGEE